MYHFLPTLNIVYININNILFSSMKEIFVISLLNLVEVQ